jgi:hypothetical protein
MPHVRFEDVDAEDFDVFDARTGNLVVSFESREDFRRELPGLLDTSGDRIETLIVYALNQKGRRVASWPAKEVFSAA